MGAISSSSRTYLIKLSIADEAIDENVMEYDDRVEIRCLEGSNFVHGEMKVLKLYNLIFPELPVQTLCSPRPHFLYLYIDLGRNE